MPLEGHFLEQERKRIDKHTDRSQKYFNFIVKKYLQIFLFFFQ